MGNEAIKSQVSLNEFNENIYGRGQGHVPLRRSPSSKKGLPRPRRMSTSTNSKMSNSRKALPRPRRMSTSTSSKLNSSAKTTSTATKTKMERSLKSTVSHPESIKSVASTRRASSVSKVKAGRRRKNSIVSKANAAMNISTKKSKPLRRKVRTNLGNTKNSLRKGRLGTLNFRKRRNSTASTEVASSTADQEKWFEVQRLNTKTDCRWTEQLVRKKFREINAKLSVQVQSSLNSSLSNIGNTSHRRRGISKEVLRREWVKTFEHSIDFDLFDKLFETMDYDRDGLVDETEFTVVVLFILKKGTDSENTKLAFSLFDADKNNGISQEEFSEMLSTIIGASLDQLLGVESIKNAFETFLRKEYCEENLLFYYEILPMFKIIDEKTWFVNFPVKKAREINEMFIDNNAEHSINISHNQRNKILEIVREAELKKETYINASIYDSAFNEVKYLLEAGTINRFKKLLRTPPFTKVTRDVWQHFDLESNEFLTFEQFKEWKDQNPKIFDFLTELQSMFNGVLQSAATHWAQSASQMFDFKNEEDFEQQRHEKESFNL